MGWIADRIYVKRLYPLVFLLQALALFMLANVSRNWHVFAFAVVYETAFAGNLIFQGVLIVQFFGTNRFASIRSLMQSVGILVSVVSPVLGGLMFDVRGSYTLFFRLLSLVSFLGIPPMLLVKQSRDKEEAQVPVSQEEAPRPPPADG